MLIVVTFGINKFARGPLQRNFQNRSTGINRPLAHTAQALNDRRSERLVPGGPLEPDADDARVPILLVQRPGASR